MPRKCTHMPGWGGQVGRPGPLVGDLFGRIQPGGQQAAATAQIEDAGRVGGTCRG